MNQTLIRATELAEFVYCSKAWHLKYLEGAEVSPEARELQAEANAWHIEQGKSLARGDSYRWGIMCIASYCCLAVIREKCSGSPRVFVFKLKSAPASAPFSSLLLPPAVVM